MTVFTIAFGGLTALSLIACAWAFHVQHRSASSGTPPAPGGLRTCLKALRDAEMLDAWADVPPRIWMDPAARLSAETAIRAYLSQPTCPISRANCMACLSALARRR